MSASPRELERDSDDEHSDVVSESAPPLTPTADTVDTADTTDTGTADTCLTAAAAAAADDDDDDDDDGGGGCGDAESMNVNCTSDTPRPPLCVSTVTLPEHAL